MDSTELLAEACAPLRIQKELPNERAVPLTVVQPAGNPQGSVPGLVLLKFLTNDLEKT